MRRLTVLIALLVLVSPALARADWQYTKWGMTMDEVKKASKGTVAALAADDYRRLPGDVPAARALAGDYKSGALTFRALFYFDADGKLTEVVLNAGDGTGGTLRRELEAKYGPPLSDEATRYGTYVKWQDAANAILYRDIGGNSVAVSYRPRQTANNAGL